MSSPKRWAEVFHRSSISSAVVVVARDDEAEVWDLVKSQGMPGATWVSLFSPAYWSLPLLDGVVLQNSTYGFPAMMLPDGVRVVGFRPRRLLCELPRVKPPTRREREMPRPNTPRGEPGTMTAATDALDAANNAAGSATTTYLLGRGLAAEIDDLRFPEGSDPIPAPGLDALLRSLGEATGEACNAADRVPLVSSAADRSKAVAVAEREWKHASMLVRALAQLLLGVSSALGWNDAVARAERAAGRVLFPRNALAVPLITDGLELRGDTRAELRTELCGAVCRMVVDHDVALALGPETSRAAVVVAVDASGNITVSAEAAPGSEAQAEELGWPGGLVDGRYSQQFPDPPVVNDAVTLVLDTLRELHGLHGSDGLVTQLVRTDRSEHGLSVSSSATPTC